MKKPFAVYFQYKSTQSDDIWIIHRKYKTMKQAQQALTDLIKTPRRDRNMRYTILPVVSTTARGIRIDKDMVEQIKLTAR